MSVKVLIATGGFRKGVSGGIPSVINNYLTSPAFKQDSQIQLDFLAFGYQTFDPYKESLKTENSEFFNFGIKVQGKRRLFEIYKEMSRFLKDRDYDIIHINTGSLSQMLAACMASRKNSKSKIIAHSHNALSRRKFIQPFDSLMRKMLSRYCDDYIACSSAAAKSLFPIQVVDDHKWLYLPNAIDLERYRFNQNAREKIRTEFGIKEKFVFGTVGRLNQQKNQAFIIDRFANVLKKRPDSILMIVGNGDLHDQLLDQCRQLNISDSVLFTGQRTDVPDLMSAMDLFLFPSVYEGLGMVLIEAQANGLSILSSDQVPVNETKITDKIYYLPLNQPDLWETAMLNKYDNIEKARVLDLQNDENILSKNRKEINLDPFIKNGYDIKSSGCLLKKRYLENLNVDKICDRQKGL